MVLWWSAYSQLWASFWRRQSLSLCVFQRLQLYEQSSFPYFTEDKTCSHTHTHCLISSSSSYAMHAEWITRLLVWAEREAVCITFQEVKHLLGALHDTHTVSPCVIARKVLLSWLPGALPAQCNTQRDSSVLTVFIKYSYFFLKQQHFVSFLWKHNAERLWFKHITVISQGLIWGERLLVEVCISVPFHSCYVRLQDGEGFLRLEQLTNTRWCSASSLRWMMSQDLEMSQFHSVFFPPHKGRLPYLRKQLIERKGV